MDCKKILFRSDGNSNIGLGHLFRSFALLEMLKDNYDCFLLTKKDSFIDVIPKEYSINIIPENISYLEEPNWISKKYSNEEFIIIADGYHFKSNYQKQLKQNGFNLVYIDDLGIEKMYADIVINHALNLNIKDFDSAGFTKFALGSEYAIVRPKFINAAKKTRKIKQIKEVFVCFGGSDFLDLTNRALEGIIDLEVIDKIHIVIGAAYGHQKNLNLLLKRKNNIFIHKNISENRMIDVMNECQLAIVPSSTISYEAFSVKMLVLGGYYIDNQKKINNGLDLNGMIYNVGDFNKLKPIDFKLKVLEIINDSNTKHNKIIESQANMFDGKQKERFNILIESIC